MKLKFYSLSTAVNTVEQNIPVNQLKQKRNAAFLLVFLTTFFAFAANAQMNLKFGTNYQRINGLSGTAAGSGNSGSSTALKEGARYLYSDVATGFDCIITIEDIADGASLYAFDNNSSTYDGEVNRFQPIITSPQSCARKSYVKFKFQLIQADSYTGGQGSGTAKTPSEPIWFRAYDIDGNGANKGISEFVEVSKEFTGSWVDNPTSLVSATPFMTGADQYKISTPTNNGTDISDDGDLAFNAFIYGNTANTFYIIGGSYTGGNQGDPVGTNQLTDADRLNSWSFYTSSIKPGVDFGDAPASYNGTTPIAPAYHVIPSIGDNMKLYLGTVKPDIDFKPEGNATASVDDANAATDDEDGITYTYFPAYSGSGNYSVTINATNKSGNKAYLYGYIDFNGDGDFNDVNERSLVSVVNSSTTSPQSITVTFSAGFSYNPAAAARYARFRISSNSSESASANGPARDGEVEDYVYKCLSISGTVLNDGNGTTDNLINGTAIGVASSTQLYVSLVNTNTGKVVESVAVASNGNYTFNNANANQEYKIVLSTSLVAVGNTTPSAALPNGWVNTAEGTAANGDGTTDGVITLTTGTAPATGAKFGIQRLPETNNVSISFSNPGVNVSQSLASKPLNGQDPEDNNSVAGGLSTGYTFAITAVPPTNRAIIYYGTTPLVVGSVITNFQASSLRMVFTSTPTSGQSVVFNYAIKDRAGFYDPTPATYTITVSSILPLNGMNLIANQQGGNVKLNWDVTGERNVVRYELEYSTNNVNFSTVANVAYRTSASGSNVYSFTHIPVVSRGTIYYRVAQYKADGSSSFSNQVAVRLSDKGGASVTVLPTLISSLANLNIHTTASEKTTINVVDNNGKIVMKKEVVLANGGNSLSLDGWNNMSNGIYYIQVSNSELKSSVRVVVQH